MASALTKMFVQTPVRFSASSPTYTFPIQRVVVAHPEECSVLDVGFVGTLEVPASTVATYLQRYRLQLKVVKIYGGEMGAPPVSGITDLGATPLIQVTNECPVQTLATRYVGTVTSGGYNVTLTVIGLDSPTSDFEVKLSGALTVLVH
jgi:hypothetical protein